MKESYYKTYSWMVDDLVISANELNTFALIYSFNENKKSFNASLNYFQKRIGVTRKTLLKSLKSLCEKGYLLKVTSGINGNKEVSYLVNISHPDIYKNVEKNNNQPVEFYPMTGGEKSHDRCKKVSIPVEKSLMTGGETPPNNKEIKKEIKKNTPPIQNGDDGTQKIYGENYQYDFSKIKWSAWNHSSGLFVKSLLEVCGRSAKISHFESQVKEIMENNIRVTDPEKYFQPMLIKHLKSFDKW